MSSSLANKGTRQPWYTPLKFAWTSWPIVRWPIVICSSWALSLQCTKGKQSSVLLVFARGFCLFCIIIIILSYTGPRWNGRSSRKARRAGGYSKSFLFLSDVVSNLLFVCFLAWVDREEKILLFFPPPPSNFFVLAPTFAQELGRKSLLCRLFSSFSGQLQK